LKNAFIHRFLISFGVLCLGASPAGAQEALHLSLAGEEAAAARRQILEEQVGNVQIGRANIFLGAGLGLEANDNVEYSDQFRQEDFIVRPGLSLAGSLPVSELNALYLSLDISYAKYIRYSQYDRLLISPGSQLGFDVYVKNLHFNFHDQVSLSQNPVAQGAISGVGTYNEFANTVGLAVDWDLNSLVATVGYDHQNAISTTSYFSYLDRSSESFFARTAFQLSQALTAGPEASVGLTAYDQHLLSDSVNYSVGAYADWRASAHLRFKPRAGYTFYTFSNPAQGASIPPDSGSYYFSLEMTDQLNEFTTIAIEAGRQLRLGVNSDLIDLWYVRPRVGLRLFEKVGLQPHFVYEQGTDSGNSVFVPNEQYTLLGGGISASYQLMQKVVLSLAYDYAVKSSDIPERNYHQNRIQVQVQYTF
jgi:hypothetical protein